MTTAINGLKVGDSVIIDAPEQPRHGERGIVDCISHEPHGNGDPSLCRSHTVVDHMIKFPDGAREPIARGFISFETAKGTHYIVHAGNYGTADGVGVFVRYFDKKQAERRLADLERLYGDDLDFIEMSSCTCGRPDMHLGDDMPKGTRWDAINHKLAPL